MTEYAIIIEDVGSNFAAYAPDVPGCVATGQTIDEVTSRMETALEMHFELMREHGEPIPAATSRASNVHVHGTTRR